MEGQEAKENSRNELIGRILGNLIAAREISEIILVLSKIAYGKGMERTYSKLFNAVPTAEFEEKQLGVRGRNDSTK